MRSREEIRGEIEKLRDSLEETQLHESPAGTKTQVALALVERHAVQTDLEGRIKALFWVLGQEWDALEVLLDGKPQ